MNDQERRFWVLCYEDLYNQYRDSGRSMTEFIRQHRDEIDQYIQTVLDSRPRGQDE